MTKKTTDALGDRMKRYEAAGGSEDRLMPNLPIMARLDGMAFHTFTKGLNRPYDERLSQCMIKAMKALVKDYQADLAYTQSDEITLYFHNGDPLATMMFDGRKSKLISAFASCVTGAFIRAMAEHLPMKTHLDPKFDCRVWNMPNEVEVYNNFLWREKDATKNSLSMAAQSQYTAKELHKKQRPDLHEMLFQKGINWNDYPAFFKRGTYARRFQITRPLTAEEATKPMNKRADGLVTRTHILSIDAPPIQEVGSITPFVFGGALKSRGDLV